MRRYRHSPAARRGFTLVELLVAAALAVMVMAIISVAFQAGLSTLSSLKSVGDMSEKLRTVETSLRKDLEAQHLEDEQGTPVRVSEPRLGTPDAPRLAWTNPLNTLPVPGAPIVGPTAVSPSRRGFLSVVQLTPPTQNISAAAVFSTGYGYNATATAANTPYWYEGTDADMESLRAIDHVLSMTVKAQGKTAQDGFTTGVPFALNTSPVLSRTDFDPTVSLYFSQWAEVVYFLKAQGVVFTDNGDGTLTPLPVFSLHRRQRVLTPVPVRLQVPPNPTLPKGNDWREGYPDLSVRAEPVWTPGPMNTFTLPITAVDSWTNTPTDVTIPDRRMSAFVDWRNYVSGVPVRQFRPLPAGIAEVELGKPGDGQVVNAERLGSDVLLNNVLSFQVRVLVDPSVTFGNPNGTSYVDPLPPIGGPTTWPRAYDTATSGYRIKAVKITVRIWDSKNKQTRQISIVQDL